MHCWIILICLWFTTSLKASEDQKHMITFGRNGLGWSGGYEKLQNRESSLFNGTRYFLNDLALNYAHQFGRRWQFGAYYQSGKSEYILKREDKKEFVDLALTIYGLFGFYNFSDTFSSAIYIGTSFSYFTLEEENSPGLSTVEGKRPFELDDTGNTAELILGKRFSFDKWGIKNLTYSPNFSIYYKNHGRDFDDQKIGPGVGTTVQPLKFDLLF